MALKAIDVETGHEQIVDPFEQVIGEEPRGFGIVSDETLYDGRAVGMPEYGEGCVPVISSSVPDEGQRGGLALDLEIFEIGLLVFEELVLHAGVLQPGQQAHPGCPFGCRQVKVLARTRGELVFFGGGCAVRGHEEKPEPGFDDGGGGPGAADRPPDELHDEGGGTTAAKTG